MPLLVGLLDSTHIRRSQDGSILMTRGGESQEDVDEELEGIIAKEKNGGGMLDSIANMANSILGAGKCSFELLLSTSFTRYAGIIGEPGSAFAEPPQSLKSRTRSTICYESSWLCHWDFPASSSVYCHGLDHSSHCHQCETQWQKLLH